MSFEIHFAHSKNFQPFGAAYELDIPKHVQGTHLSTMRDISHEMERVFLLAVIFLIFAEKRLLPREPVVDRSNLVAVADGQTLREVAANCSSGSM